MPKATRGSKKIFDAVKESVLDREAFQAKTSNFHILEQVLDKGIRIPIPRQEFKATRPTIMVFSDDKPLFNWAHPCRYLLHDATTGELYKEISASFPPYAREKDTPKTFYTFHEPVQYTPSKIYTLVKFPYWRYIFGGARYAILFSGMSNNRHTNDLEFAYRALINVYGFSKKNITVLNYDGTLSYNGGPKPVTQWPGDSSAYTMPVNGKGGKADLLAAINSLKSKLKPDDFLFIHTNNHGGHNGIESDLCCYPNYESLGVKEFTDKLAELPNYRCLMVMMEQCHSGGFNNAVISKSTASNTSIASACTEFNNSIGGADFDPFARDWIAAMMGNDPYGHALVSNPDTNGNGRVTAREAFNYANTIHDPYDTPVFNFSGSGNNCWLGRDIFRWWFFDEFLIERIIRKHWPEPDPLIIRERILRILPQLTALNEKMQESAGGVDAGFEKQLTEIILKAKKI